MKKGYRKMKYEAPQIKINECEQREILTVSSDVLEDDKIWGEIS